MYFDHLVYAEHMRKAHQEVITEQKEQDENYWICPIHKKSIVKFGRCEQCGGRIIVMIRKKIYKTWLEELKNLNDHAHQWIKALHSKYWFDTHCLFCNRQPQDVGIHEMNGIYVDYEGKEVTIKIDSS